MKNTIFYNCTVYTGDSENPRGDYVWITDEVIRAVGPLADLPMNLDDTDYIDGRGAFMLPGFHDSHLHLSTVGANIYDCSLEGTASIAELKQRVGDYITGNNIPAGDWVLGKGWNQDYFSDKRLPSKADLDEISPDHKICLIRGCYHLCVINSLAIDALGIRPDTTVENGIFDVHPITGETTGICRENAMKFVLENLPPITVEKFKHYVKMAEEYLLSLGVTSVLTDDFMLAGVKWTDVMTAYKELAAADQLKIRVFEQCLLPKAGMLAEFLQGGYHSGWGEGKFQISMLKLLSDGNFGNHTAALKEPYSDQGDNLGIMNYTGEELDELFALAYSHGLRIGVHCIGDRAAEMVLKAERDNAPRYGGATRLNLIHCQMANEGILRDMTELGVVGSIQPAFLDYDIHMAGSRLGDERCREAYNWNTMVRRGIPLAMGSDSPITVPDPFMAIYCAVTRQDFKGFPPGGWYPEERLSVEDSIRAYTQGSAYAAFMEDRLGRIKPGMLADLILVDKDPFGCPANELLDIQVLRTVVGGVTMYLGKDQT